MKLEMKTILESPMLSEGSGIFQGISRRNEGRAYNPQAHILYTLSNLRGKCSTYLELGVLHGATMCLMARVLGAGDSPIAVGVDWFSYYQQHFLDPVSRSEVSPGVVVRNFRIWNPDQKVFLQLVKGDTNSPETVAKVGELFNGRKIDVIFIDATHTAEQVQKNFDCYSEMLADDAVVVISGYNTPEVKDRLDKFKPRGYNKVGIYESIFIMQKRGADIITPMVSPVVAEMIPGAVDIPEKENKSKRIVPLISLAQRRKINERREKALKAKNA